MINGINSSNHIIGDYNRNLNHTPSFGRLEKDDSFEKPEQNNEAGFLDKVKQGAVKIKNKTVETYLSILQFALFQGYRDKNTLNAINDNYEKFKKTPEGIRRANMSNEEIEKEINNVYDKSFDKLGIDKNLRPKLVVISDNKVLAGGYKQDTHTIEIDANAYRKYPELESVVMHEATHAKEALMRASIPQQKVDETVKNELLQNDKTIHILSPSKISYCTFRTLSPKMKDDFANFADKNLFNKSKNLTNALIHYNGSIELYEHIMPEKIYTSFSKAFVSLLRSDIKPIYKGIDTLLDNHPEFVKEFKSREEAFNTLMNRSLALNCEYNMFTDTKVGGKYGTKTLKVKELSGEELKHAEKSLIHNMSCKRANLLHAKEINPGTEFLYRFCPEEVLAEITGREFQIKSCSEELAKLKKNGILTKERENFLNTQIDFAKSVIAYRKAGGECFDKFLELVVNPENKELEKYFNEEKQPELDKLLSQRQTNLQRILCYDKLP